MRDISIARLAPVVGFSLALGLCLPPAEAGVSVSINPESTFVAPDENFTAYMWIDESGSEFNGYEAVVRFDEAMIELVSVQEESLMTDLCGNTWWMPEAGPDSVFFSHVAMCGPLTITGPGALSSMTFRALQEGESSILFDYIEFYDSGNIVPDVVSHDGLVICSERAVCCVDNACHIVSLSECDALGGSWHPAQVSCDPNPCLTMGIPEAVDIGLFPARPNPFTQGTILEYHLEWAGPVRLNIFDPAGRLVRHLYGGHANPGVSIVEWNGLDDAGALVQQGAYFCRFSAEGKVRTQRLIVLE